MIYFQKRKFGTLSLLGLVLFGVLINATCLQAAQQDLVNDIARKREVPTRGNEADESTLFHTTSGPVKPAASVFRAKPNSMSWEPEPTPPAEKLAALQQPSGP